MSAHITADSSAASLSRTERVESTQLGAVLDSARDWTGRDAAYIGESVLNVLIESLELDFASLRFDDGANVVVRLSEPLAKTVEKLGRADELALLGALEVPLEVRQVSIGGIVLFLAHVPLGVVSSLGHLIVGVRREAFPSPSEWNSLRIAAAQVALAFRELGEPIAGTALEGATSAKQKRNLDALVESERNLRFIIDNLPVLAFFARPDGSADFINAEYSDFVGMPAEQLLDFGYVNAWHPDDVQPLMSRWMEKLDSDSVIEAGRFRRYDGEFRECHLQARKITDLTGAVRWLGVALDIEDLRRAERALRASESRLQESERALVLMLDTIPAMAWSTAPDGMAEVFNKNMLDYLGRTRENMKGLGFLSVFHPDDVDRMVTEWHAMMASKQGGEVEGRVRRADGEYRWVICRCNPLLNEDGDVVRWYGVNIDIQDRKHAENALRASEAALAVSERNFSLILNSLPVLVWSARADGTADFVNQSFLDYVGLPLEQVLNLGFTSVFHPDDADRMMQEWVGNLVKPTSVMRGRIRRFDGEYRWFYFSGRKFEDAAGNVRWFGVLVDIEDQTRAENAVREREVALRESEARMRHIINTIPALVWSSNAEGAADFLSQHFLDYTGLSFDEAVGFGWTSALHPDEREDLLSTWRRRIETRSAGEYEARLRRVDGQYRRFLFRHSPRFDENGNLTQWFGVNLDIEDRKATEEELRKSQADLAHITRMTTMGELTISIAHEVNQPLMAIVTNAGTCLRWLDDAQFDLSQARLAAQRVIKDGHRAGDILASIRALARKAPTLMVRMDLKDAIDEMRELLKAELHRRGVESQIDYPDVPLFVVGDRTQLQQVILNLVMNGVEAMVDSAPEDKRLDVEVLTGSDGFAQVCVADRGSGLGGASNAERVFDAFFSTKAGGIGMGLSICRSIVEAHGGRIWAADNQPRGSVFHFTVPLAIG